MKTKIGRYSVRHGNISSWSRNRPDRRRQQPPIPFHQRRERESSNCSGNCTQSWSPLLTVGDAIGGEGVAPDRLEVIARDDGSSQVTYNGWPLYYFAKDEKPGDTNGQDVGTLCYLVSKDGAPVQTSAKVNFSVDPPLGNILTDASGRTLYLFTNDEPDATNCSGNCTLA